MGHLIIRQTNHLISPSTNCVSERWGRDVEIQAVDARRILDVVACASVESVLRRCFPATRLQQFVIQAQIQNEIVVYCDQLDLSRQVLVDERAFQFGLLYRSLEVDTLGRCDKESSTEARVHLIEERIGPPRMETGSMLFRHPRGHAYRFILLDLGHALQANGSLLLGRRVLLLPETFKGNRRIPVRDQVIDVAHIFL